jgi:hypothetical protein
MPVLLEVKLTTMAGVEVPPHPDTPSVRTAIKPNRGIVALFTNNLFRHTRARSFSRFFQEVSCFSEVVTSSY